MAYADAGYLEVVNLQSSGLIFCQQIFEGLEGVTVGIESGADGGNILDDFQCQGDTQGEILTPGDNGQKFGVILGCSEQIEF